tara:strand:+ start:473 stop:727 length:255 start_codon:yes stop_codon:yes gene_type:complete
MIQEKDYPQIIIEPDWNNWDWYYFIPYLDRKEWDGVEYDSVKYGWDELDYRFGVDYNGPTVPEPSSIGFIIGATLLAIALMKRK